VKWRLAGPDDTHPLARFVEPREHRSLTLSSRLLRKNRFQVPPSSSDQLFFGFGQRCSDQSADEPQAIVLRTSVGLLLPLFHEELDPQDEDFRELGIHLRRGKKIYCILGMSCDVDCCADVQPHTIDTRRYYLLMRRLRELPLPTMPDIPGLKIHRVNRHNAAKVFPLEEAYQREEVLVHPDRFSPTAHFLHFTRTIRRNRVYYAELDGRPVAKAGTNAQGGGYCQVGGVYTLPEYRGRGISRALMITLMSWIYGRNQSAVLFVHSDNQPAHRLYYGLDFSDEGEYEIVYTKLD
jgi:hypothetical protein